MRTIWEYVKLIISNLNYSRSFNWNKNHHWVKLILNDNFYVLLVKVNWTTVLYFHTQLSTCWNSFFHSFIFLFFFFLFSLFCLSLSLFLCFFVSFFLNFEFSLCAFFIFWNYKNGTTPSSLYATIWLRAMRVKISSTKFRSKFLSKNVFQSLFLFMKFSCSNQILKYFPSNWFFEDHRDEA